MTLLLSIILLLSFFILFLLINSPGKLPPLVTTTGKPYPKSLSEKCFLSIGGHQQGLFILSENIENPVLLFLHGGPGSPELPLVYAKNEPNRLEKDFTVCYWDQRGAGMSLKHTPEASMSLEQLVADTLEVTDYLKKRFNQDKLFLMGHSWGSYLGIKTVAQAPEHYAAYIGMGQLSQQKLSERLAYDYLLDQATNIQDNKTVKALKKFDPSAPSFPSLNYVMSIRSSAMNRYGIGITHKNFSMMTILKQLLFFKGYTLGEKINYLRGSLFSLKHLFPYTIEDDLTVTTRTFALPVYVTHGKYDMQVSYELARDYVDTLSAPKKAFFTFEHSAHTPIIEEREKFVKVLNKIKNDHLA
ncbi:alpha/beta hydrolase [Vagococcus sp. BWB3-3]|uniref:Alpha/beta hydrolase n=1 Tax=Vagococcus allomyrinae TaxID=2794353 RepID=A0A940STQ6_9ENTE|nr:alpha/beta hydrolase [Vagococcus allomyrinae]MBP1040545.1 alpha/beta hydrolase [Vagococcus allomyrinae]